MGVREIQAEELETFQVDGVLKLAGVVPLETLARLEEAIDPHLRRRELLNRLTFGDAKFFTRPNVWKTDPFFFAFSHEPLFIDLAAQLLESRRISLLQDQIFVKLRGCKMTFGWHQDHAYAPIEGTKMLSFWMASKRITRESGGLEFIRGSHLWTEEYVPPVFLPFEKFLPYQKRKKKASDVSGSLVTSIEELPGDRYVSYDLDPGDVVAFHGRTFHRSHPNQSLETERKGWAVRFVGDDVTYKPGPHTGITYNFWDAKLDTGAPLDGPLFPLLLEDGRRPPREFTGPQRVELRRVVASQLQYLWRALHPQP